MARFFKNFTGGVSRTWAFADAAGKAHNVQLKHSAHVASS